jgi:hypothetical protein
MLPVRYFCSWWGLDHLGVEPMLRKIRDAGYDGVEIGIPEDRSAREALHTALEAHGLQLIVHQYQAEGAHFADYRLSLRQCLERAAASRPLFINSHTGRDYWSVEQNLELIDIAQEVQDRSGVPILHESHRGRFLYSAPAALEYFSRRPNLRITADLSHWVIAAESLLVGHEAALEEAVRRADHIHVRVGSAELPQVDDPFSRRWSAELQAFSDWWLRIARRFHRERRERLTITMEFGPPPYCPVSPETGEPLADFFEINLRMKDYMQDYLTEGLGAKGA